tara:strand:+ start:1498 stop:2229 length:732 start_codon:yes stop_codon:yes gene_type:complete
MLMTMLISAMFMEEVEYPWGSLGKVGPSREDISVVTDNVNAKLEEVKSELLDEISALRDEIKRLQGDIVGLSRSESGSFDDRSVTSFLNLDELNISEEPRPEVTPLSENPDVRVVTDGFVAPPPEPKSVKKKTKKKKTKKKPKKDVLPNPYKDLSDDSIAFEVYTNILHHLGERGPVMNNNLKRVGIVPEGAIITKGAKAELKELVANDSELRFYQVDKIRGFYYREDGRDPQTIYDEDIAKS